MLEDFALRYFDLSLTQLALLSGLVVVVGGVLGWLMPQRAAVITRAPYFAIKGALVLALAQVGHIAMQMTVPSLLGEYYWAVLAMQVAGLFVFGFIAVRLAAARSRDAFGHGNLALLCLVPLLSLILIFKGSRGDPALRQIGNRSLLTGEMGAFVGGFLMVLSVALNNYVQKEQARRLAQADQDHWLEGDFLRFRLQKLAENFAGPKPYFLGTQLVRAEQRKNELHFRVASGRPADRLTDGAQDVVRRVSCADPEMQRLIKQGIVWVLDFQNAKGEVYASAIVDAASCAN